MLALAATATVALHGSPSGSREPSRCERVYIGTQISGSGQGIGTTVFDPVTGTLSPLRLAADVARPTWLLADTARKRLYATSDPRDVPGGEPRILSYAVDGSTGDLRQLSAVRAPGSGPTHLSLNAGGDTLFVAHYGSGQVAALAVGRDGVIGTAASVQANRGTGPSPRQTAPHAHAAVPAPTGRFVLVPDLGADRVFVYRFDPRTRALTSAATPFLQLPPGDGPRHLVFARNGRHAYLVSELASRVRTLRWDARAGTLSEVQVLPLDSPDSVGPRSAAEIGLSPDGRTVYVSNRGDDMIVSFNIDRRGGTLTQAGRVAAGGKSPWAFTMNPSGRWMLVTNQASDTVSVLPIDPGTGLPRAATGSIAAAKPVTVTFAGPTPCPPPGS